MKKFIFISAMLSLFIACDKTEHPSEAAVAVDTAQEVSTVEDTQVASDTTPVEAPDALTPAVDDTVTGVSVEQ